MAYNKPLQQLWPESVAFTSANETDSKTLNIATSCQLEMKEVRWQCGSAGAWSGNNLSGLDSENCAEEF
jgi:hypothetical protein